MKQTQEVVRDLINFLAGNAVTDEYGNSLIAAGSGGAGMNIKDTGTYITETTVALGANGTFTGPWRDAINYNYVSAMAWSDVAGTVLVDEADAATPNVTNLLSSTALAATPANSPTPPAAGFQTRVNPAKTVLRFVRVRFINGASAQTRLNIQFSLSPLN